MSTPSAYLVETARVLKSWKPLLLGVAPQAEDPGNAVLMPDLGSAHAFDATDAATWSTVLPSSGGRHALLPLLLRADATHGVRVEQALSVDNQPQKSWSLLHADLLPITPPEVHVDAYTQLLYGIRSGDYAYLPYNATKHVPHTERWSHALPSSEQTFVRLLHTAMGGQSLPVIVRAQRYFAILNASIAAASCVGLVLDVFHTHFGYRTTTVPTAEVPDPASVDTAFLLTGLTDALETVLECARTHGTDAHRAELDLRSWTRFMTLMEDVVARDDDNVVHRLFARSAADVARDTHPALTSGGIVGPLVARLVQFAPAEWMIAARDMLVRAFARRVKKWGLGVVSAEHALTTVQTEWLHVDADVLEVTARNMLRRIRTTLEKVAHDDVPDASVLRAAIAWLSDERVPDENALWDTRHFVAGLVLIHPLRALVLADWQALLLALPVHCAYLLAEPDFAAQHMEHDLTSHSTSNAFAVRDVGAKRRAALESHAPWLVHALHGCTDSRRAELLLGHQRLFSRIFCAFQRNTAHRALFDGSAHVRRCVWTAHKTVLASATHKSHTAFFAAYANHDLSESSLVMQADVSVTDRVTLTHLQEAARFGDLWLVKELASPKLHDVRNGLGNEGVLIFMVDRGSSLSLALLLREPACAAGTFETMHQPLLNYAVSQLDVVRVHNTRAVYKHDTPDAWLAGSAATSEQAQAHTSLTRHVPNIVLAVLRDAYRRWPKAMHVHTWIDTVLNESLSDENSLALQAQIITFLNEIPRADMVQLWSKTACARLVAYHDLMRYLFSQHFVCSVATALRLQRRNDILLGAPTSGALTAADALALLSSPLDGETTRWLHARLELALPTNTSIKKRYVDRFSASHVVDNAAAARAEDEVRTGTHIKHNRRVFSNAWAFHAPLRHASWLHWRALQTDAWVTRALAAPIVKDWRELRSMAHCHVFQLAHTHTTAAHQMLLNRIAAPSGVVGGLAGCVSRMMALYEQHFDASDSLIATLKLAKLAGAPLQQAEGWGAFAARLIALRYYRLMTHEIREKTVTQADRTRFLRNMMMPAFTTWMQFPVKFELPSVDAIQQLEELASCTRRTRNTGALDSNDASESAALHTLLTGLSLEPASPSRQHELSTYTVKENYIPPTKVLSHVPSAVAAIEKRLTKDTSLYTTRITSSDSAREAALKQSEKYAAAATAGLPLDRRSFW